MTINLNTESSEQIILNYLFLNAEIFYKYSKLPNDFFEQSFFNDVFKSMKELFKKDKSFDFYEVYLNSRVQHMLSFNKFIYALE